MTYDQYWYGDPLMVRAFYESYKQQQEIKRHELNYEAWLHGLYNFNAVSIAIGNAFRKDKKAPESYPNKPFDMDGERDSQPLDEDVELALAESYMKQMVRAGKNWGKSKSV